jgi:hypothetical protein
LRDGRIDRIDYFSLDTEGYEYNVVQTIDWSYNSVRVISIEKLDSSLVPAKEFANQQKIRALLSSLGLPYLPWLSQARGSMNNDEVWVNLSWIP